MSARGAPRTLGSRADLAWIAVALAKAGLDVEAGLAAAAGALGYSPAPPEATKATGTAGGDASTATTTTGSAPADQTPIPFWQPHSFEWHGDDAQDRRAEAVREAEEQRDADAAVVARMQQVRPPVAEPLTPRRRLVPLLQRALTAELTGRELDVAALIRCWTRGHYLRRLPRVPRRCWPSLVIAVDLSMRLATIRSDMCAVLDLLASIVGDERVTIREVEDDDLGELEQEPLAGRSLLVLSDLGWYDGGAPREAWLRLGRQLRRAGESIHALVPVPPARWTEELAEVWAPLAWERPRGEDPERRSEELMERLLDLAAHARRLEPGLLRTLRRLLPDADVGVEIDAWRHKDLGGCPGATVMRPERAALRQTRLGALPVESQQQLAEALRGWHWHRQRRPELWYMEALALAREGAPVLASELARAERFIAQLGPREQEPALSDDASETLRRWLRYVDRHARGLLDRDSTTGQHLQRLWWTLFPPDEPPSDADPTLVPPTEPSVLRGYTVLQRRDRLVFTPRAPVEPPGGVIGTLWAETPKLYPVGAGVSREPLRLQAETSRALPPAGALELRTDRSTLRLREFVKPAWAQAIGRDHHGLWVELDVKGITFRMRWIPPGRFLMGSPEDEPGHYADEGPQHLVTLTQGFWLGETQVTQALWQAVTGENPSRFKSPDRPVEMVTWEDCQVMLRELNKVSRDPQVGPFRLPTEAEWEYACRAGTSTATYAGPIEILGENNAPVLEEIAWYGGNSGVDYDLAEGQDSSGWLNKRHEHSKAGTRRVGLKQANQWGLHDMLGNVWEWCSDWYGEYSSAAQTDPAGAAAGGHRVVRGGSWDSQAGDVRAACRNHVPPGVRADGLGLRLARDQGVRQDPGPGGPESGRGAGRA